MKKIILVFLSCLMIISLAGCGGSSSGGNNNSSNTDSTAWYEKTDKKEQEIELDSFYQFSGYNLEFDGDKVIVSIYIQNTEIAPDNYVVFTGTYSREKNIISSSFNGYEIKYRVLENGLINISQDVCKADSAALTSHDNILFSELRDVDFSSLAGDTYFQDEDSRFFLYKDGYVFYQFSDSFNYKVNKGQKLDSITSHSYDFYGEWEGDYLAGLKYRYNTIAEYTEKYRDNLDLSLKMMDYIIENKDVNPLCYKEYYSLDNSTSTLGFTLSRTLENIGALYWTMGEYSKSKEAFKSIPNLTAYYDYKFHRDYVLNDFNMNIGRYVLDANGFLLQDGEEHYQYDQLGRLNYKWKYGDSCYKYTYNEDSTYVTDSVFVDRYGNPLHDIYTNRINPDGSVETINQQERTTDYPSWINEVPCGLGK